MWSKVAQAFLTSAATNIVTQVIVNDHLKWRDVGIAALQGAGNAAIKHNTADWGGAQSWGVELANAGLNGLTARMRHQNALEGAIDGAKARFLEVAAKRSPNKWAVRADRFWNSLDDSLNHSVADFLGSKPEVVKPLPIDPEPEGASFGYIARLISC